MRRSWPRGTARRKAAKEAEGGGPPPRRAARPPAAEPPPPARSASPPQPPAAAAAASSSAAPPPAAEARASTEVRQSTATRLAAAAANPQLAKTLDASSSLADNYSLLGVLGKGSYGEVRLAIHKLTKKRVAVKTLTRAKLTDAKLRRRAEAEVKVHKLLRHAHIARLFEVISSQASINLCMQHAACGTLRELLDQHGALPEARARRYLRQICGALHYCHEVVHVVHRDIKLDNMLLDANDNVLLADFGFAEVVGPNKRKLRLLCGSPHYSAPEIFAQQEYVGSQADMWSLGVLAYTLLAGHFPFQADTMDALGKKVRHGRWDRPLPSSTASSELVAKILVVRASQRATLAAVCDHRWMLDGAAAAADVIPFEGEPAARWDDAAAAELDAMGCSAALVRHHVQAGAHNHVTAAFDILVAAGASGGGGQIA